VLQFVCECDVVKDTGKEEYLRPFIHIGFDWIYTEYRSITDSTLRRPTLTCKGRTLLP